jgi:hypothetical protein
MKHFPLAVVLAIALVLPAFGEEVPFAQRTPSQIGQSANANVSRLSDIMVAVQLWHAKLWYSGSLKNWPLADYELGQIKDSFEDAARLYANIPVDTIVLDTKSLNSLGEAIKSRDQAKFIRAFTDLTSGCNDCHRAAQLGFIVMKIPTASPFSNQSFAPTQK